MIVAVQSENPYFMGVIFCAFGFMVNPLYPLVVEFMCEGGLKVKIEIGSVDDWET